MSSQSRPDEIGVLANVSILAVARLHSDVLFADPISRSLVFYDQLPTFRRLQLEKHGTHNHRYLQKPPRRTPKTGSLPRFPILALNGTVYTQVTGRATCGAILSGDFRSLPAQNPPHPGPCVLYF
ncbi:hypothetical protein MTO96_010729 [Rhipicephalus appendiculatus]